MTSVRFHFHSSTTIIIISPFHSNFGFEHFGVRAHVKGEYFTRPCRKRTSSDGFVLEIRLVQPSACAECRGECRAHVVLCPGARLRSREKQKYHTEDTGVSTLDVKEDLARTPQLDSQ